MLMLSQSSGKLDELNDLYGRLRDARPAIAAEAKAWQTN